MLTLQVIGELILSLTPEESARVFPDLYLPIVTEANKRVWAPWRAYVPLPCESVGLGLDGRIVLIIYDTQPALFKYKATVNALNNYFCDLIRKRWSQRQVWLASVHACWKCGLNRMLSPAPKAALAEGKPTATDILEQILADIDPATWSEVSVCGRQYLSASLSNTMLISPPSRL